jgi:putative transposase
MSFKPGNFYHVYNCGNNKQKIFFTKDNYLFFKNKMRKELIPCCSVLAYCLMPNHFHLLIYFDFKDIRFRESIKMESLDRKIGTLQSSYTRAVNNQQNRTGSLFQAKFKMVEITDKKRALYCLHYIHQNPVKAALTKSPAGWEFSSFGEYQSRENGLCDKVLAEQLLGLPLDVTDFGNESEQIGNNAYVFGRLNEEEGWEKSSDHEAWSDD